MTATVQRLEVGVPVGERLFLGDLLMGIVVDHDRVMSDLLDPDSPVEHYADDELFHDPELEAKAYLRFELFKPDGLGSYCIRRVAVRSEVRPTGVDRHDDHVQRGYKFFPRGENYGLAISGDRAAVLFCIN